MAFTKKDKIPEKTEEQKEAEKIKSEEHNAMAGTLLKRIMKKNCGILSLTMLLNIGGMAGELLSPLFIGWVIQAIIAEDYERVNRTIIYWVIISSCGSLASFISSYGYTMIANYTG